MVLAANGPVFCAGHDLKELTARRSDADGGRKYFHHIMTTCSAMMQSIVKLPQPVIAAVQGVATAAGCQLVATCDLAVASTTAKFATPGVDIGLFCSTPMVALSRNVTRKHAMHMLLTGEPLSAEEAQRAGLINRVTAPGRERDEALALAEKIAAKSSHVVKIGKKAFYEQVQMPLAEAYDYAAKVMTENMMASDANEGICAFIEKRRRVGKTNKSRRVRLRDFAKVAMPAKAVLETARARDAAGTEQLAAVIPFLNQRLPHAQSVTL